MLVGFDVVPYILGSCAIIFVLLLVFALLTNRDRKTQQDEIARELGFVRVSDKDPLFKRIAYLNGTAHYRSYQLSQVYKRTSSSGEVYLYNLSGRVVHSQVMIGPTLGYSRRVRSRFLESCAFAFVAPSWNLPRFKVSPRTSGEGMVAQMFNQLIQADMGPEVVLTSFPHIPALDSQYLIGTRTGKADLPDSFFQMLASYPNLRLRAGGDTLTLSYADSVYRPPDIEQAKRLFRIGLNLAKEIGAK